MFKKAIWTFLGIAGLGITAYASAYITRLPESAFHSSAVSETWSKDHAYKATLQEKNCGEGETIIYSVRVDAPDTPPLRTRGWFAVYDVEDDEYPDGPPNVHWQTPRMLLIDMKTRTLGGSLRLNAGDDLTIVRNYSAKAPNQFSNF